MAEVETAVVVSVVVVGVPRVVSSGWDSSVPGMAGLTRLESCTHYVLPPSDIDRQSSPNYMKAELTFRIKTVFTN
jgi:hypothetical protein